MMRESELKEAPLKEGPLKEGPLNKGPTKRGPLKEGPTKGAHTLQKPWAAHGRSASHRAPRHLREGLGVAGGMGAH